LTVPSNGGTRIFFSLLGFWQERQNYSRVPKKLSGVVIEKRGQVQLPKGLGGVILFHYQGQKELERSISELATGKKKTPQNEEMRRQENG